MIETSLYIQSKQHNRYYPQYCYWKLCTPRVQTRRYPHIRRLFLQLDTFLAFLWKYSVSASLKKFLDFVGFEAELFSTQLNRRRLHILQHLPYYGECFGICSCNSFHISMLSRKWHSLTVKNTILRFLHPSWLFLSQVLSKAAFTYIHRFFR